MHFRNSEGDGTRLKRLHKNAAGRNSGVTTSSVNVERTAVSRVRNARSTQIRPPTVNETNIETYLRT